MDKKLEKKGKHLSFLLRHDTEYDFDEHGYREVNDLIKNHGYTRAELDEIVETNDKKRYEFNNTKTKIRARQGHSISINVDLKEAVPPAVLFHGTATKSLESIHKGGIEKRSRNYVHLSADMETAFKVGARHGQAVVLMINAAKMHENGIKFYLSNNNVWLTDYVSPEYIYASKYE